MDFFGFLKRVYFFKNLSDDELRLVSASCHEERYEAGSVIFPEGATADRFFIVIEGKVEVWKNYYDERADLLGTHGPGHFFGEMALVDDLPRSATAVAKEDTHTLFLYRDEFHSLLRSHASIALSVMTAMSFLVRSSNELYVEDLRRSNEELKAANESLERAQAERLRAERLSTLGKFSSMILHDIRNPIAMLKGQLQLMLMHLEEPERLRKIIGSMETATMKLERLAGEFLDYSRGEIRLDIGIVDPQNLVKVAVEEMRLRLEREGIRCELSLEAKEPILADAERLSRVLVNLIDNARKAMRDVPERSIRLSTRFEADQLLIAVEDNGQGMDDETMARLFEPFYSASAKGGTGLGLLIVKNVVEAHGGSLRLVSELGKGTRFTIALPRRGA